MSQNLFAHPAHDLAATGTSRGVVIEKLSQNFFGGYERNARIVFIKLFYPIMPLVCGICESNPVKRIRENFVHNGYSGFLGEP